MEEITETVEATEETEVKMEETEAKTEETEVKTEQPKEESKTEEKPAEKKIRWKPLIVPGIVTLLVIALVVVAIMIIKKNVASRKTPAAGGVEPVSTVVLTSDGEIITKEGFVPGNTANGINDTGDFTLYTTEYEGREGTGEFNYGEALQKAILFYELQRSGDLPEKTRCNWRGDSALADGADNGVDLTGGLYDAGDHVKFNLPMAYTSAVLAWSYYENPKAYEESGQKEYALNNIRWIDDYLIKCHTGKEEFYYQVGNGGTDHGWWGPCEIMTMERPSYKVDAANPGSTVTAESAAALAAASVIFKGEDDAYAKKCLEEAKAYYEYAAKYLSDAGYTQANGFYDSHSGFYDELSFAAAWLYLSTGEDAYQKAAAEWFGKAMEHCDCRWTLCWDDASYGTALIMGRETQNKVYTSYIEESLDYWTTGVGGERVTYTPKGLAWLDSWGSLRYASSASFLAITYSKSAVCPKDKQKIYHDFAVSQIGYCLGSTGFSYEIGFGDSYPVHPHHRTAQGSPSNNMNDPAQSRHTLCGALVGGPDANDSYTDEVSNYVNNEVADDYNAGFVGALAALYEEYGGKTLKNYGAVENIPSDEIHIEGNVNVNGENFIEIRAYVCNASAWPARSLKDATLCYFVDLSEVYEAGGSVSDISVNMNYSQGGNATELKAFDEANHIYYLPVSFAGSEIAPGSQDKSRREVQFRMTSSSVWDNSNDYSYQDVEVFGGGDLSLCEHMALFEGETLVFGSLPDGEGKVSKDSKTDTGNQEKKENKDDKDSAKEEKNTTTTVSEGDLKLEIQNQSSKGKGSTMAFTVNVTNEGKADIDLSSLTIIYYFSEDNTGKLNFYCDYACIQGDKYEAITDAVSGKFASSNAKDKTATAKLEITFGKKTLPANHTANVQVRVARDDWSEMNFDDDYSAAGPDKMVIRNGKKVVLGTEP